MSGYRSLQYVPPLVQRAKNLAEQMGYPESCSDETGRLLQLLASQYPSGVIGELGAGCGVASAWMVSALSPGTSFFAIEDDLVYSAAARPLFDPLLNVRILQGDWREFVRNWRFSMLYAGRQPAAANEPELLLQSLRDGSLIVLDGLLPQDKLSLKPQMLAEKVRGFWLNDPRLLASEVQVSPAESVILATRIG